MDNRLLYTILLFLCSMALHNELEAQDFITYKTASKRMKEAYKKAKSYVALMQYAEAEKAFAKLERKYPNFVNIYTAQAGMYAEQKKYKAMSISLEKLIRIAPDFEPKAYLSLGKYDLSEQRYEQASQRLKQFLTYEKVKGKLRNKGELLLGQSHFIPKAKANPLDFQPQNLGSAVNSAGREYFPSLTVDEGTLVYTVQKQLGRGGQEDLYMTQKDARGAWRKGGLISGINTSENEAAQSISADGRLLVFTVCNRQGDYGSCDLYYSEKRNGQWNRPRNMGGVINSGNWESQPCLSPNGDALYFSRGKARGQGGKNIYVSYRQKDGQWGMPQSVDAINTTGNEMSPFLHADGQTLYFASDGHIGMGGLDIFYTRKQADGTWGEVKNMGYPINTEGAEESLIVNRKGDLAYMASEREGGMGSLDIYSFELPKELRPSPATFIDGIVQDAKTKEPLRAMVELVDLKTQKTFARLQSQENGEFLLCMPFGDYAFRVEKEGYLFYSENFELLSINSLEKAYELEANLQSLAKKEEKHQPIVLKNVFFATASAVLQERSFVELNTLHKLLVEQPTIRIEISGHTDNEGEGQDNQLLSEQRAQAVCTYLIDKGIEPSRLESKGFGEQRPVATNDTKEGRKLNRRTEFVIIP